MTRDEEEKYISACRGGVLQHKSSADFGGSDLSVPLGGPAHDYKDDRKSLKAESLRKYLLCHEMIG